MLSHEDDIIRLRHDLHRFPNLSGEEDGTVDRLVRFILSHHPTKLIKNLGGHGIGAVYQFGREGPTIAIRAELDALPIEESNDLIYRSKVGGVSHACGHDGHMAIVAGLVFWLKEQDFKRGTVVLLFQPAEETGLGAKAVLEDQRFHELGIEYIFALHNIPGEPLHNIILLRSGFSAEVQSFSISVEGKETHASTPQDGINPAWGLAELISSLSELNISDPDKENFALLTPIYMNMGAKTYGVSPAAGELHYTIRTWNSHQMNLLKNRIESVFENVCSTCELEYFVAWFEHFPASQNDADCNQYVIEAAHRNGLLLKDQKHPFRFGEDFGWFSKRYKTALFGLGAGKDISGLHDAAYNFPDELIESGIRMFSQIIAVMLER